MKLKKIGKIAYATAAEKGFYDDPVTFGERIALIHSEASEALEEYRKGKEFDEVYYPHLAPNNDKPEGIPIELSDIIIRVCDMATYYGIDLEAAVKEKLGYNNTRPHKHGGKKI